MNLPFLPFPRELVPMNRTFSPLSVYMVFNKLWTKFRFHNGALLFLGQHLLYGLSFFGLSTLNVCGLWNIQGPPWFYIMDFFMANIIVYKNEVIFTVKARKKKLHLEGCSLQELNLEVVLFHSVPGQQNCSLLSFILPLESDFICFSYSGLLIIQFQVIASIVSPINTVSLVFVVPLTNLSKILIWEFWRHLWLSASQKKHRQC